MSTRDHALQLYRSTAMSMLPRIDDDDMQVCEIKIARLVRLVKDIGHFRQYDIRAHSYALEVVLEAISQILDKAEGE